MTRAAAVVLCGLLLLGGPGCGGERTTIGDMFCDVPRPAHPSATGVVVVSTHPTGADLAWRAFEAVPATLRLMEEGTGQAREVGDGTPRIRHTFPLASLSPATRYDYVLEVGGEALWRGSFRTLPAEGEPLRLAVVGDTGSGCEDALSVRDAILAADPDAVLHTGDTAYYWGNGEDILIRYYAALQPLLASRPVYVALGNHDVRVDGGAAALELIERPVSPRDRRWYALDQGPARVIALDTNANFGPGSAQHTWLVEQLASAEDRWLLVFFHHPPYTTTHHGDDPRVIEELCPLFDAYGVDLVFCGHAHGYQRTFPIRDGQVTEQSPGPYAAAGPIYVVTGGGSYLHEVGERDLMARTARRNHFVLVELTAGQALVEAVDVDGAVLDRFTVAK